jgi:hypothetical protein
MLDPGAVHRLRGFIFHEGIFSDMKKKKEMPEVNLLELVPERTVDSETGEDGIVTVLGPRFKSGLLRKLIEPRLKNPFLKIKLDEIGSAVWSNIDGERNVGLIGEILKERFGDDIEPCFERLSMFFTQLELSRYIRYRNLESVRENLESRPDR